MSRKSRSKPRNVPEPFAAPDAVAPAATLSPRSLFLEATGLKLLVFWNGAVVMGLEIAGSRLLAPHFGNSVFVWGSLISVFLIALSVGYYVGGQLADRHPSRVLLNSLCMVVSFWVAATAIIAQWVCTALVESGFGEESGPLAASLLLFLPPSIGMGVVSPFAIRLATEAVSSVGKIAGTLYALSTLGSIVGTMLTTFVLIPWFGTSTILKGLGLTLLLVSLATFPFWDRRSRPALVPVLMLPTLATLLVADSASDPLHAGETSVLKCDTPYHNISVVDDDFSNTRQLRFDRYVESSIELEPPYRSTSLYTDYFHLAFLAQPELRRALFIGAGGAAGPRAFHMHDPAMQIDVVDIDARILEIARSHFFLDDAATIHLIAEDGRMFVRTARERYDCIVLDAFTIGGRIPFHLVTREYFQLCHDTMTDGGVFVMNINSAIDGPLAAIFHSTYRTMHSVFPNVYAFADQSRFRSRTDSMNIILLATRSEQRIPPAEWTSRARSFQPRSYVDERQLERMAANLLTEIPDVSNAALFTDDYAPIETMAF